MATKYNYDGIDFVIDADGGVQFKEFPAAGTINFDRVIDDDDLAVLVRLYKTIFALGERRAQAHIAEKVEDLMGAFDVTFRRGV